MRPESGTIAWGTEHGLFIDLRLVGQVSTGWRIANGLSTHPGWVMTKATEELGEVARALVGEQEQREGRGDMIQETAQTIIVLASLLNIRHPEADLAKAIADELRRLGAV